MHDCLLQISALAEINVEVENKSCSVLPFFQHCCLVSTGEMALRSKVVHGFNLARSLSKQFSLGVRRATHFP